MNKNIKLKLPYTGQDIELLPITKKKYDALIDAISNDKNKKSSVTDVINDFMNDIIVTEGINFFTLNTVDRQYTVLCLFIETNGVVYKTKDSVIDVLSVQCNKITTTCSIENHMIELEVPTLYDMVDMLKWIKTISNLKDSKMYTTGAAIKYLNNELNNKSYRIIRAKLKSMISDIITAVKCELDNEKHDMVLLNDLNLFDQ